MIDWHSHILPGLDDGAETLDQSLEMGRLLARVGFTTVHCTPHCLRGMYDNRPKDVRDACAELQEYFDREQIGITLYPGMEYCLDEFFPDCAKELLPLGESNFVLVETPSRATTQQLKENVFLIKRAGYEPLFAHPERHAFLAPPKQYATGILPELFGKLTNSEKTENISETPLAELVEMGCSFQCNLGSVGGYYGRFVQKQARRLIDLNLYRCVGSDLHNVASGAGFLDSAIKEVQRDNSGLLMAEV